MPSSAVILQKLGPFPSNVLQELGVPDIRAIFGGHSYGGDWDKK